MRSWPAIGTNSTWRTKGSQEWSGNGTGWRTTRGSGGRYSEEQLPHSVVQSGSPLGFWQATDHRGGDQSTQGLLRTGAPSCEDAGRPLNAFSSQDRSIHLGPTDQQLSWPPVAPPGGPVGLVQCTSLVLGLPSGKSMPNCRAKSRAASSGLSKSCLAAHTSVTSPWKPQAKQWA